MKIIKVISLIALTIFISFFTACEKDLAEPESIIDPRDPDSYEWVGEFHNHALEFIYQRLEEKYLNIETVELQNLKKAVTKKELLADINEFGLEYFRNTDLKQDELEIVVNSYNEAMSLVSPIILDKDRKYALEDLLCKLAFTSHKLCPWVPCPTFPPCVKGEFCFMTPCELPVNMLLDNLITTLGEAPNLEALVKEVDKLNIIAKQEIGDEQLLALFYTTTSVAKHSAQYWVENGPKWQKLASEIGVAYGILSGIGEFLDDAWDSFITLVIADATSTIGGALKSVKKGRIGWGTLGEAASYGIVGSTSAAGYSGANRATRSAPKCASLAEQTVPLISEQIMPLHGVRRF